MKKVYLSYKDVENNILDMGREILTSTWRPDYIVGIGRGGLLPATLLSHFLKVPMNSLDVSFRDGGETTTNAWMAEDAFGYINEKDRDSVENASTNNGKNILIVDDINDSGKTLKWIQDDWMSGCLPSDDAWDNVWGNNVRILTLVNNEASDFDEVDYAGFDINKAEEDCWIVFPWEEWWSKA